MSTQWFSVSLSPNSILVPVSSPQAVGKSTFQTCMFDRNSRKNHCMEAFQKYRSQINFSTSYLLPAEPAQGLGWEAGTGEGSLDQEQVDHGSSLDHELHPAERVDHRRHGEGSPDQDRRQAERGCWTCGQRPGRAPALALRRAPGARRLVRRRAGGGPTG